jgi:hypothetical protein
MLANPCCDLARWAAFARTAFPSRPRALLLDAFEGRRLLVGNAVRVNGKIDVPSCKQVIRAFSVTKVIYVRGLTDKRRTER